MVKHIQILPSILPFFFCFLFFTDAQTESQKQNPPLKLPTLSIIEKLETFQLETDKLEWVVKNPPVFPNSEQIIGNNGQKLVNGKDYQIDYVSGKIIFDKSVLEKKEVVWTITYRSIPFTFQKTYKRDLYGTPLDKDLESTLPKDVPSNLETQPTVPGIPS